MTKLAPGVVMALTILTGEGRADFMDGNQLYADCTGICALALVPI